MPDINWSVRVVDEDGEGMDGTAVFVDYGGHVSEMMIVEIDDVQLLSMASI